LLGRHQHANAWVALAALNALPAPFGPVGEEWPESFSQAYLPGRFDVRGKWIFDVAHNPDGATVLKHTLQDVGPPAPIHVLLGVLGDKDYLGMIRELAVVADGFVFTVPPTAPKQRRWNLRRLEEELAIVIKLEGLERPIRFGFEPDFDRALELVQQFGAGTVIVTGSFHTVGDALARLPGFAPVA